jgi:ribosomal-protein-alanine N-acetyltransferase
MDEGRPMELTVSQRADTGKSTATEMDLNHNFDQALTSDLEGVQQLELETYGEHAYSYVVLRQFLDTSGELFQVCRDAGRDVIAYGIIARSTSQDTGWLHSLVVSVDHRRKGIGIELSKKLIDKAGSHSLKEIFLTVKPDNKAAISLYKRLGFADVKFEPHYYGRNEGRIVMRRL